MRCGHCDTALPAAAKFCPECGRPVAAPGPPRRADAPAAYTPRHLAEKILTSRSALEGERKQVTVLFVDIKGSMELSEGVDPEEWHQILDRFFAILTAGVHRFEGTINQYTGDGVMALFGAPIALEDHAQRAAHAALHLRDELRRYADELRLQRGLNFSARMGLNSGDVVVGRIGDDLRMDYTAIGHTVGLAARMEQIAEPGRVYCAEATARLLSGFFELRDLGLLAVKGVPRPVRVAELERVGQLRTRFEQSQSRGLSRFVGRDAEMGRLERALGEAAAGRGRVVGITAGPGFGKTRLAHEFAERCLGRGLRVTTAHGVAHGRSIPLLPWLEQVRNYFGLAAGDAAEPARDRIAGRVLRLDPSLAAALPALFEFLGVGEPGVVRAGDTETRQRELFEIIPQLMRARTRRGDLHVHVWDDVHWFDPGSVAGLSNVVEHCPDTLTLVVMTYRPDFDPPWRGRRHCEELALAPLGGAAVTTLLDEWLGTHPSLAALRDAIGGRAAGNPFFVEELVRALAESGALSGVRGAYRNRAGAAELAIPPTVQAVLAARIDRLPEPAKLALQALAVAGKRTPRAVAQRVVGPLVPEFDQQIDVLISGRFIDALPESDEYVFAHPLTHEVAYGAQLAEVRARTHAAVAETLAATIGERPHEQAAVIAHHWERAGESLPAARWHRWAATWTMERDLAAALRHWREVLALTASMTDADEPSALRLLACGAALEIGWRHGLPAAEAERLYGEGRELAARRGDTAAADTLEIAYQRLNWSSGRSFPVADRGRTVLGATDDDRSAAVEMSAVFNSLVVQLQWGTVDEALATADSWAPVIEATPGLLDEPGALAVLGFRGLILGYAGRLPEGLAATDRAVELARARGLENLSGLAIAWSAQLALWEGAAAAAMARARQAAEIGQRIGSQLLAVVAGWSMGAALALAEEWQPARLVCGEALGLARTQGVGRQFEPALLSHLAEALAGCGENAAASSAAAEAVAAARALEHRLFGCRAWLALARVRLAVDGGAAHATIESALREAAELAAVTGLRNWLPLIAELRGALAAALGDTGGATRARAEAHLLYETIGATAHAERIATTGGA
jgi:class 3 adenylate cyclase